MTILVRMARSFSTQRLIIGLTALALTTVLRTSVASSDVVQLRNVDGGQNYYSQFSNSLPSDPSYFPIGVWFESVISQADVDLDKDAGLNLYVVLTANSRLSLVERNGMRAILQQSEWRTNKAAINSSAVAGWELFDEIDMQQGPDRGYTTLNNILAQLPNDGRMRYNNYGKGVLFWETNGQAKRFVNDFQQVVSNDVYWFTDPHVSRSSEGGKLLNGGKPFNANPDAAGGELRLYSRSHARPGHETQADLEFRGGGLALHRDGGAGGPRHSTSRNHSGSVAQHHRRGARHHLFQPQLRWPQPVTALPARSGIFGSARRRKEHQPTRHAACASAQRTIRGQLRQRRSIGPDDGEVL